MTLMNESPPIYDTAQVICFICCQKIVKKLSKSWQKVVKKLEKKCQKVVKNFVSPGKKKVNRPGRIRIRRRLLVFPRPGADYVAPGKNMAS
jgi:hypothetical protein